MGHAGCEWTFVELLYLLSFDSELWAKHYQQLLQLISNSPKKLYLTLFKFMLGRRVRGKPSVRAHTTHTCKLLEQQVHAGTPNKAIESKKIN